MGDIRLLRNVGILLPNSKSMQPVRLEYEILCRANVKFHELSCLPWFVRKPNEMWECNETLVSSVRKSCVSWQLWARRRIGRGEGAALVPCVGGHQLFRTLLHHQDRGHLPDQTPPQHIVQWTTEAHWSPPRLTVPIGAIVSTWINMSLTIVVPEPLWTLFWCCENQRNIAK
jgi:hypothetical protein